MNIKSSLVNELRDRQYRDAFVASQIKIGIPFQIRALRKSRTMTQPELAKAAGMSQPRISEIETPGSRNLNLETLLRIAAAFDIALEVRFAPFSEFIENTETIELDSLSIASFEKEVAAEEEKIEVRKAPQRVNKPSQIEEALEIKDNRNLLYISYRGQCAPQGATSALIERGNNATLLSASR